MADIHDHVKVIQGLKQLGIIPDEGDIPPIIIGEVNDGINVGNGLGLIYGGKTGVLIKFRTLKAGAGIVIGTDEENETVDIAATGTGAGDVEGTPPSFTNALAIYYDTTGLKIKNSNIRYRSDSDEIGLQIDDPNDPGVGNWFDALRAQYIAPNGTPGGTYVVLGNTSKPTMIESAGPIYVNPSGKRVITETTSTPWDIPARGKIHHANGDTQEVLTLENTGTNPGEAKIFIGNRTPEGNVIASQGDLYIRKDGDANSTPYFKDTGTGNTGWVDMVGAFVSGPVSSLDNEIPVYNGITGKVIKNSPAKILDQSNSHVLQFDDPGNPASWLDAIQIERIPPNGTGTHTVVGNISVPTVIRSGVYNVFFTVTDPLATPTHKFLMEAMASEWALPKAGSIENDGADTNRVLELKTTGTNPGESKVFIGNRTPEGNVTADQGALYVRDDGVNSAAYIKGSGVSNTGWSNLVNPNVGFYAYRAAGTQTIPASTETKVEFPDKQDDPGGDFSTTTDVFTAPTKGTYAFSASAMLNMDKDTEYYLRLYHNTTLVSESSVFSGFVSDMTSCVSVARRQMDASDTMEVRAFQNDALGRTLQNTALHFAGVQLKKDL